VSKKECFDNLRANLPKEIKDEIINEILDDLERIKKSSEVTEGDIQAFRDGAKRYLDDKRLKLANLRQERARDIIKNKQRREFYLAGGEDEIVERMFAYLGGSNKILAKGVNRSVDRITNTKKAQYNTAFTQGLDDRGLLEVFRTQSLNKEIMQDLWALTIKGGRQNPSGSKEAFEIAKVINGAQEMMLQDMRAAGADVGRVQGYVMKQSHDPSLLRAVGRDEWIAAITPRLDLERTFGEKLGDDAVMREFMESAYDDIVSGKLELADVSELTEAFLVTRKLPKAGRQVSKSRKIHFKSGEDFFEYNELFGRKDLGESLWNSFETNARMSTLIDMFGSDPLKNFVDDIKIMKRALKDNPKELQRLNDAAQEATGGLKGQLTNLFTAVNGHTNIPTNNMVARVSAGIRATQNMSKLGLAAISSISDLATSASIIRSATGQGFLKAHANAIGSWAEGARLRIKGKGEFQRAAENIGLLIDTHLNEHYLKFGADGANNIPGQVSRLQRQFFKYSGLSFMTNNAKFAVARVISKEAADNAGKTFDQLPIWIRENMARYGIDSDQWNIIRQTGEDMGDGFKGITPDRIRELEGVDTKLKRTVEINYQAYLIDNAELGSPTPNARIRNRVIRGTRPGDPMGEVLRFAGQFKSFPLTIYDVMSRIVTSNPERPAKQISDVFRGRGDIRGMMGLMTSATALGYLSLSAKAISKNQTPPNPDDPKTWRRALIQGGSMGLYGDLLLGEYDRFNQSLVRNLAGPTFGQVDDAAKILANTMSGTLGVVSGEKRIGDVGRKFGKDTWRLIERNAPAQNLFYLRTSMDYLFLDTINEAVNPGFKVRREQRLLKENREPLF